ncbi:unnamed protein product [Amoebophrya sp. A25]|nr:unnamed protein product [Amoebophrya sp. A25]|eukprot:GSA25T00014622001.1
MLEPPDVAHAHLQAMLAGAPAEDPPEEAEPKPRPWVAAFNMQEDRPGRLNHFPPATSTSSDKKGTRVTVDSHFAPRTHPANSFVAWKGRHRGESSEYEPRSPEADLERLLIGEELNLRKRQLQGI